MPCNLPRQQSDLLICFAVKEEAKFFRPVNAEMGDYEVLITGMGRRNASEAIRAALPIVQPSLVLTCGFAGGLNPKYPLGTVLFDEDFDAGLHSELVGLGCISGKFHCARRVAVTTNEKNDLWNSTEADAVEMESSVIRTICREFKIPSATVRVILDDAHMDLPLDFNALMTSEDKIDYAKLMWAVMRSPQKIPALVDFQRQTVLASQKLASVLHDVLKARLC